MLAPGKRAPFTSIGDECGSKNLRHDFADVCHAFGPHQFAQ